jgi:RNA polymerase sigma-70 factor, ECF subfamily
MDLMDLNLQATVKKAKAGDESAFAELYQRFSGPIFRFVWQMSGSKTAAEDILQEVFLVFVQKLDSYDMERGNLSSYLYGIARNIVMRWLQQHQDESMADGNLEDRVTKSKDGNPLAELTREELVACLRKAILTLPATYREVIVLCELQELSYQEAASIIGCAIGTVRSRLHRGRSLLLQKLHPVEGGSSEKTTGGISYELSAF